MNGVPNAAAIRPTRGPHVGRSGLRGVANLGGANGGDEAIKLGIVRGRVAGQER